MLTVVSIMDGVGYFLQTLMALNTKYIFKFNVCHLRLSDIPL